MQWFKHDSKAHNDEKHREAIHEFGVEAYAVYNILLELIAEKMDEKVEPKIVISDRVLREKLRLSHQKVTKILSFFDQNTLIFSNFDGKSWNLHCPNLLKRLDDWTSRSGVARELLRQELRSKNKEERSKKQIEVVDNLEKQPILKTFFSKLEIELIENILTKDFYYPENSEPLHAQVARLWLRSQDSENPINHALEILKKPGEIEPYKKVEAA